MCAQFMLAFDYMIRNEDFELSGDIVAEPNGGKARFGINSVFHPQAVEDNYYSMSRDHAFTYCIRVYQAEYWEPRGFEEIGDQRLATKLFDMAVGMGNKGEILVLQDALEIPISGIYDDQTRAAMEIAGPLFLDKLVSKLKSHYLAIHEKNPGKYRHAVPSWLARAARLPK